MYIITYMYIYIWDHMYIYQKFCMYIYILNYEKKQNIKEKM